MDTTIGWGVAVAISYILGSVPSGLLVASFKGVDIRREGSGNIGATNVFRTVGKGYGILTFACDLLKGLLPALVVRLATGRVDMALACGCAAIAGHNWPIFLRFKGGKGVATSAGVLLGVVPLAAAVGLGVWVLLLLATGYVAVASMGAALSIPAVAWVLFSKDGLLLPSVLTVLGLLVIYTHRTNLQRLARGTEHRFQIWKKRQPSDNA